ncbi:MAG: CPBP family intramembrane glutamic endopeptidase [Methyloglobulus sp.]
MRRCAYVLAPLMVLLFATFLACILAYFLVLIWDDALSFRTIIRKSTQLFLVLSIFPAMHYLKLNKFDLGFSARPRFIKQVLQGVGLGFITLMPVFIVLYLLGVNIIDDSQPWTLFWISKKLVIELLLALLISLFEEPVFRGILLTGLSKKMSVWTAIIISAFYYAILHFLDSKTQIPAQEINLFSGFKLLGEAFTHLLNPEILSAFFALFAVGVFLGVLRTQVKASLGLCIGCHACWVWQIKLSKSLFNINPSSDYLYLVSNYDGVVGPLVTTWLTLAIVGYFMYQRLNLPSP